MNARTVVITGASSGIGLATARRFAAAGDHVVNLDLNEPSEQDAVGRWIKTDATDWNAVRATVDAVVQETGSIDVVVANAGISLRRTFVDMTEEDIRRLMDINVMGVMALWQAAARHMIEARRGVLLATASTNGSAGYPYYADYNASKAAVLALSRSLALELAPHVRTACVSPGYVMTPMQRAEYTDEMFAEVNAKIPANRHADPAEVAAAFFFLASDDARFITGQQLIVDGGELAGGTASAHGTAFA
ncbi:SDR family NAD(P)-dependent oxidoreductase [Streptomyces sp. M41]|uniref:SDR family NAD(P)-dependent oxidoreductase n=1 Tax=Streptomyces sp. M41 TaxID=3059412 RepID=UPI00374DF2B6